MILGFLPIVTAYIEGACHGIANLLFLLEDQMCHI